jgi:hypothetical protein
LIPVTLGMVVFGTSFPVIAMDKIDAANQPIEFVSFDRSSSAGRTAIELDPQCCRTRIHRSV